MAITNYERVSKALDLLKAGVSPFVEREFKAKYGDNWVSNVRDVLSDTRLGAGKGESLNDIAALLVVMDRKWSDVLRQILGKSAAASNLKPWREVVTPHKDVASGRYQQAEFAADLWQVQW